MRIVLDAMGSDQCPEPEITASVEAAKLFGEEIILVGPEERLKSRLAALNNQNMPVRIVNAMDTITMEDKGTALALKAKRKNSDTTMAVGMDLVLNGEADAFITAGNTGGAMATAYFRMGTIPGVERPAVAGIFPIKNGHCTVLDIGANPDCKAEHLMQFAIMGSVFSEKVRGINRPRIGLLSNGEEAGKGNELIKATYPLLDTSGLNFIGNVESKEVFGGNADVVVTDGFTGNIFLKTTEAVAKLIVEMLKVELKRNVRTSVGALLAKPAFTQIKKMLDPGEIGGAPLLGVNGLVFIAHGRSDAYALVNAIAGARLAVEANLLETIRINIAERLSPTN